MITVSINGLEATVKNLTRIEQGLADTSEPMRQATLVVTGAAKRNAPVDTGVLRASIMPGVKHSGNQTIGVVGSKVAYAPFQELGTRAFWPPIAALQTWARRHGTTAYVVARAIARRGLKARRYLGRALDDNRARIVQIFEQYVRRLIQ